MHPRQECVGSHWSKTATEGGMRSAGLDSDQHSITLFKAKHAGHLFSFQDRVRVWVLDEAGGARCTRRCGGMSDGGGAEYFLYFRQIIFSNSTVISTNAMLSKVEEKCFQIFELSIFVQYVFQGGREVRAKHIRIHNNHRVQEVASRGLQVGRPL